MRNTLATRIQATNSGESDQVVSTIFSLYEEGEAITLLVSQQRGRITHGTDISVNTKSELELKGMSPEQVGTIAGLVRDWLESKSRSTISEVIEDVDGWIEWEVDSGGYNSRLERSECNFENLYVSVGQQRLLLATLSQEKDDELEIPSATLFKGEVPSNFEHITTLDNMFYDFFERQYSGEIPGFEIEGHPVYREQTIDQVERIFEQFDGIAGALSSRRGEREPLLMDDEYDVQYILGPMLRIVSDDVRAESNTRRHSGMNPKIDFLLEEEAIGIEVKRPSPTRNWRSIREEMAEDKIQYEKDGSIDTLLFFLYDPDRVIPNPVEVQKDFNDARDNMVTRVTITN